MVSNNDRQRFIEDFHIGLFAELHPLPGTPLPRTGGQKPDFLFSSEGRTIGLEHTELVKDRTTTGHPSLAELKGAQRSILQRAATLATGMGLPPISLNAWFHDAYTNFPNKGEAFAATLAEYVKNKMDLIQTKGAHGSVKIARGGDIEGILMMTAISGKAFGKEGLCEHRWMLQEPGFVRHDFSLELQKAIDKKNAIYHSYAESCSECWLLIVADRMKDDQRYEIDEPTKSEVYRSKFAKTFFMETTHRLIVELKTAP